jgi:alcohol dehydrogenase class IV
MNTLTGNWNYPTTIKAGAGRIKELPDHCLSLNIRNPLLVTDPGLATLPIVANALNACHATGLGCSIFSQIKSNPTDQNVMDGVSAFISGHHDGVIAFGGGSALDAGKAIALMVGQSRPLWDFEDIGDNHTRVNIKGMAAVIAVPTTAGTGSEVGRASVITDDASHTKRIIFHERMLPAVVILDPNLTTGLPANLTAATGMDALSHNLEALCSPLYHPMATGIGMEGCRLIRNYLRRAVESGSDLEARQQMLVASSMGATAFQKGLGAMHALAHPLGALYDAHHGTLNAILMPYVLKANETAITDTLTHLSHYLQLPHPGFGAVLDWVLDLREAIGIPHTLAQIHIPDDAAEIVGEMATKDPSASTNPIAHTAFEYNTILRRALTGVL